MLPHTLPLLLMLLSSLITLEAVPRQVMAISYAEVDASYNLNAAGKERAAKLPNYFASLTPEGFGPPQILFGAKRSPQVPGNAVLETATPLCKALKLPIHPYPSHDIAGLVNKVMTHPSCDGKNVLIVWDAETIQQLIAGFGYSVPPSSSPFCYALTYLMSTFPAAGSPSATVMNQDLLPKDNFCGGVAPPAAPPAPVITGYLPITIYNGTTSAIVNGTPQPIDASQIYLFIQSNGGANAMQFTADGSGNMLGSLFVPAPTPGNAATYYSSYFSYPLSQFPSPAAGFYRFYIPSSVLQPSSRIYFSDLFLAVEPYRLAYEPCQRYVSIDGRQLCPIGQHLLHSLR